MPASARRIKSSLYFPGESLPLAVVPLAPQPDLALHQHDFTELVIITGGSGLHVLRAGTYPLTAGDVFVIPETMRHGYAQTSGLTLINILFRPTRLHLLQAELKKMPGYHALLMLEPKYRRQHAFDSHLRLSSLALTRAAGLAADLRQELTRHAAGYELMALAIFMQLLGHLARQYEQSPSPDTRALLRISSGISYLERNYQQTIRLQTLCAITHQSPRGLIAAFNAATGMAPIEYLINVRIRRACELLRQNDLTITEAAFRVGFSDSNYFSRQFRKIMAMSPRQFRARA